MGGLPLSVIRPPPDPQQHHERSEKRGLTKRTEPSELIDAREQADRSAIEELIVDKIHTLALDCAHRFGHSTAM